MTGFFLSLLSFFSALPRLDFSFLLGLSPRWLGISPRWLGVSPRCEPLAGAGIFPKSFFTLSFFGAICAEARKENTTRVARDTLSAESALIRSNYSRGPRPRAGVPSTNIRRV